jgi:hypothetical protein
MHFFEKNVQKDIFIKYSLKKVEKSGGLWGEMITFAPKLQKYKKYTCAF